RSVARGQPGRARVRADSLRADLRRGTRVTAGPAVRRVLRRISAFRAAEDLAERAPRRMDPSRAGVRRDDRVEIGVAAARSEDEPDRNGAGAGGDDGSCEPGHGRTSIAGATTKAGSPNDATSRPAARTTGSGRAIPASTSARSANLGASH